MVLAAGVVILVSVCIQKFGRMPFLSQPSLFSQSWDRHGAIVACAYPVYGLMFLNRKKKTYLAQIWVQFIQKMGNPSETAYQQTNQHHLAPRWRGRDEMRCISLMATD